MECIAAKLITIKSPESDSNKELISSLSEVISISIDPGCFSAFKKPLSQRTTSSLISFARFLPTKPLQPNIYTFI